MYCIRCGARLPSDANFCNVCGTRVYTSESAVPQALDRPNVQENQSAQSRELALPGPPESRASDEVPKTCPHCGLISPLNALRCDCGYDFQSHTQPRDAALMSLDGSEALSVRSVFSEAFGAITKARSSALIWTVATAFVQFLTGVMFSNDLLMGKAFHASDGIVVGLSLFVQSWIWSSIVGNALSVVRGNQVQTLNSIVPLAISFAPLCR
jgi:hypothetical protein